jgi:hypothetical protein
LSTEPLDPQVAELLSASLDGALTPEEQEAADLWLERSPLARLERDALAEVKATLTALPEVEPPAGFFEAMLEAGQPRPDAAVVSLAAARRRRGHPAILGVAGVAAAAAWLVLAGPAPQTVHPPLESVAASVAGGDRVALARQHGVVAWDDLPEGLRGELRGASTWVDLTTDDDLARVVVARAGNVYTLASEDLDADQLLDQGAALPAGDGVDDGFLARARRAAHALVDALSGG